MTPVTLLFYHDGVDLANGDFRSSDSAWPRSKALFVGMSKLRLFAVETGFRSTAGCSKRLYSGQESMRAIKHDNVALFGPAWSCFVGEMVTECRWKQDESGNYSKYQAKVDLNNPWF